MAGADELTGALLARCHFPPPGSAVYCAVSGGADSLALLRLAVAAGLQATAVHVDHGLRPASGSEAGQVEEVASRLGAAFEARRVVVEPGANLEARARQARYAALPADVLTGHTADDHAETILLNLLRGAGLDGLAPMRDGPLRRPLLDLRRHETRALCCALGWAPLDDPSNRDPRFTRNRIRHDLLPMLAEVGGRDPVPILVRQAALLGDEAALLDELAAAVDPTDAKAMASVPDVLARRALRRWLRASGDAEHHPPSSAEVERVLAVVRGEAVACELAGGRRVHRSGGRLSIGRLSTA